MYACSLVYRCFTVKSLYLSLLSMLADWSVVCPGQEHPQRCWARRAPWPARWLWRRASRSTTTARSEPWWRRTRTDTPSSSKWVPFLPNGPVVHSWRGVGYAMRHSVPLLILKEEQTLILLNSQHISNECRFCCYYISSHVGSISGMLLQVIKEFRDEEMEHHDTGLEQNAESVSILFICIVCVILN